MTPLAFPFGPLDLSTPDSGLVANGTPVPCRTAAGVVAGGDGYVVPEPEKRLYAGANICGVCWQVREAYGDDDDITKPLTRLVVVTGSSVLLVDPAGVAGTLTAWTFDAADNARIPQFAAYGDNVVISLEDALGFPEEVLILSGDVCVPYRGPNGRAFVPNPAQISVQRSVTGDGSGLTFGKYAVRYAVVFRDGSRGPASGPSIIDHTEPVSYPYELEVQGEPADTTLTITGTAAHDAATVLFGAYGGPFPLYIGSGNLYTAIASQIDGTNTVITLDRTLDVTYGNTIDVHLGDRAALHFVTTGSFTVAGLTSDERDRIYDRVVVLLSPPIQDVDEANASPYFEVAELPIVSTGVQAIVKLTTAALLARAVYEEGAIGVDVYASRTGALNGRLYLGDVTLDPPVPTPVHVGEVEDTTPGAVAMTILEVVVETERGEIRRWGAPYDADTPATGYESRGVWYPDPRAKLLHRYVEDTPGAEDYKLQGTFTLEPSATMGIAIGGEEDTGVAPSAIPANEAARDADNEMQYPESRGVLQSAFGQPSNLNFSRYAETGASAADEVLGLVPLSEEVSSGQFGEFPFVVLCRGAIYAARLSDTGDLAGFAPLVTKRGAIGPRAFVVEGRTLYYAATSGIYRLGSEERLSAPLHLGVGARTPPGVAYSFSVSTTAALGVYDDGARRELLVVTGTGGDRATWVLPLDAERPYWTRLARSRVGFAEMGAGVSSHSPCISFTAAAVWREGGGLGAGTAADPALETVSLVTAAPALAAGLPVVTERLALLCDASGDLYLEVLCYVPDAGSPLERHALAEEVLGGYVFRPEERIQRRCRLGVRALAVRLSYETGNTPMKGDRFAAAHFVLNDTVRARRPRLIPT
jgi:hypothetical protein